MLPMAVAQPDHRSRSLAICFALTVAAPEFHNFDDASNDCAPLTVDFQNVQQFLLYTARFDDSHVL